MSSRNVARTMASASRAALISRSSRLATICKIEIAAKPNDDRDIVLKDETVDWGGRWRTQSSDLPAYQRTTRPAREGNGWFAKRCRLRIYRVHDGRRVAKLAKFGDGAAGVSIDLNVVGRSYQEPVFDDEDDLDWITNEAQFRGRVAC